MENTSFALAEESQTFYQPSDIQRVFTALVIVSIILFNSVTLWIIPRMSSLPIATKYIMISVCFIDLLTGFTFGVSYTLNWAHGFKWYSKPGNALCTVSGWIQSSLVQVSILDYTSLSIDRYLKICHPLRYDSWISEKRVIASILFTWIVPFAAFFPCVLGVNNLAVYYSNDLGLCSIPWHTNFTFSLINGLLLVGVPFSVCCVAMAKIVKAIIRQRKQIQLQTLSNAGNGGVKKVDVKLIRNIFLLTAVFMINNTPFMTTTLLDFIGYHIESWLFYVACCFLLLNSLWNPVVYAVTMKQYRNLLTSLFTCKKE